MTLIGIPSKIDDKRNKDELALATQVLEALDPNFVISDGFLPWSRTLAYATLELNISLKIAQPWRKPIDPRLLHKAQSVSIFHDTPYAFFAESKTYFEWVMNFCTHGSKLKDSDSHFTHMYMLHLSGLKIYEHER